MEDKNILFPNPCTYVKESTLKIIPSMDHVKIDKDNLEKFVTDLLNNENALKYPKWSESHFDSSAVLLETLLRYIFTIDTLNYCFWPNEGFEYYSLAKNLYETLKNNKNFFEIENLVGIKPEQLKENVFKCDFNLINERARMIREVFTIIKYNYQGSCVNFVKECNKDATKLVKKIIDEFCCFRDHAIYNGENDIINFTKETISQLTMFADYRVPQILKAKGVLQYDKHLTDLINNKKEIPHGSKEEVEIRAATIQVVEQIKNQLKNQGKNVMSIQVDVYLWEEGEKIKDKMEPHHRTLSIFY